MNLTSGVLRLTLSLTICNGLLVAAGSRTVQSRWGDLTPVVTDRKVALVLPEGTNIEGKVLAVEPEGLRIRVSKTSDRKALAKGERLIPRQSVSVLRLTEYRKMARLLCTLGSLAAAGAIIGTQEINVYEGPLLVIVPAVAVVGTAGVGVAGYFIGKRIDKRDLYIRILPEN